MRSWRWKFPPMLLGGLALVALASPAALGQVDDECNGFIDLAYNPPPTIVPPPFDVNVRITLGGGDIIGGSPPQIFYPFVHFWLDCKPPTPPTLAPPCTDDGTVMLKTGTPITTTCTSSPGGPTVTWTATPGPPPWTNNLIILEPFLAGVPSPVFSPPGTAEPPGECHIDFQVTVIAPPSMGTCSASFNTCNLSGPNTCPGAPVETCDEEIPQIVDYLNLSASGIDPNKEAFCTNGLTSGGFQTAAIGAKPKVLSDFDCYQADSTFSGAATVADMFLGAVPVSVQVGSAQRLCAPAVKVPDNMTPAGTLPTEHLVGYEITSTLRVSVPGVTVHSPQFGTFTVNVTKVAGKAALLVPSNKTVKPNPPPPQDTNTTNHFLCYNFDTVTGGIPGQVMVRDQFNPDPTTKKPQIVTFTKQKSWRLCVPVNKNGLDPTAPNNRNGLLCLVTGPDMQSPLNNTFVNWSNQFQHPATNVHPDKLDDFCVPVTVTP